LLEATAVRAVFHRRRSPFLSPTYGWRITAALKASNNRPEDVAIESGSARARRNRSVGREREKAEEARAAHQDAENSGLKSLQGGQAPVPAEQEPGPCLSPVPSLPVAISGEIGGIIL